MEKSKGVEDGGLAVARALSHPTRVRILMAMNAPTRRMSPKEFCNLTGDKMGHVSYHFRELAETGCIELVAEVPRRGATEHYYEPVRTAMAWSREWEALGSYVKQNLSASVLRGGVETIGAAIDSRSFEAQPNSHLSWDTLRVDAKGWDRATAIMDRALEELLEAEAESAQRIDEGSPSFLATFLMSTFESPPEQGSTS
jgi:DNA-binding transcriptional ArsR family regulator